MSESKKPTAYAAVDALESSLIISKFNNLISSIDKMTDSLNNTLENLKDAKNMAKQLSNPSNDIGADELSKLAYWLRQATADYNQYYPNQALMLTNAYYIFKIKEFNGDQIIGFKPTDHREPPFSDWSN